MNYIRMNKAIKKAKEKIAMKKLEEAGLKPFLFFNDNTKKWEVSRHFYTKDKLAKSEEKQIEREEKICKDAGVEYDAMIFIDDLGDEFEGTE